MTDITTALMIAALAACITFVTVYWTTAPWWRSEWGRHTMAFVASLGLLVGLILTYRVFGDYPGRRQLLLVSFAALTLLLWQRVYLVIRAQRPPTEDRDPGRR